MIFMEVGKCLGIPWPHAPLALDTVDKHLKYDLQVGYLSFISSFWKLKITTCQQILPVHKIDQFTSALMLVTTTHNHSYCDKQRNTSDQLLFSNASRALFAAQILVLNQNVPN